MKSIRDHVARSLVVLALAGAAIVTVAATAQAAFPLRVPQVTVNPGDGALQAYFNSVGEAINVSTDQLDAQTWSTSLSGNSTLSLMIEIAGFAAVNEIGVYNGNGGPAPPLYQIFPGAASPGWHALAHFGSAGDLTVSLFDNNGAYQGQTAYLGVDKDNFGFYLKNAYGPFYSQDARNGGNVHVLTFAGTGVNFGSWWQCFEDLPGSLTDWDYQDAVLLVESVAPVPAGQSSWGRIKGLYR